MDITALEDRIERTRAYESRQVAQKAIESAQMAHMLLNEIIASIKPGMRESEVKQAALDIFAQNGIERTWHPPYIRFAEHTLLTFQDKAQEDYVLGEDAIAFVDIGIVKAGIEGDAGRTVVFGERSEYHRLRQASETIFDEARTFWRRSNPTGMELYNYIHELAAEMDVEFNLDPAGHLIGEFPHRGWKKGINHYPQKVVPGCWILEFRYAMLREVSAHFTKIFSIKTSIIYGRQKVFLIKNIKELKRRNI